MNLEETKTLLRRTPGVLDVLLRGLPDPWVHEDEGPDTWSSFEVVGHLIEAEETNWIPRVRHLMAHGESAVFPPFDRFGFVEKWRGTSMAELWASSKGRVPKASRISTSFGFHAGRPRTPGPASRLRTGHPRATARHVGIHDLNHLGQIVDVLARQHTEAVGPWRAFLGILET